jgi:hypothetical protein
LARHPALDPAARGRLAQNDLPRNLKPSSLFPDRRENRGMPPIAALLWSFATRWPHANIRHDRFAARPA